MALEGRLVLLREEQPEDISRLTALRNDLETQAWSKSLPPDYTENMLMKRYQAREFSFDPKEGRFAITLRESGEFVGSISYTELQPRWSATIGVVVDKKFWSSGLAEEAQELLLKFLFIELGLRVVRLFTHGGNPRAIGLAKKAGFKVAMRQREAIFKNGELYDNLVMDLLREEFFALHSDLVDNLPELV